MLTTAPAAVPLPPLNAAADAVRFAADHGVALAGRLEPQLWVFYQRATLLGRSAPERVTVDWNIRFEARECAAELPGAAVIELKQTHFSNASPCVQALRRLGLRSEPVSKYCLGIVMTQPVRHNVFRPMLRDAERAALTALRWSA